MLISQTIAEIMAIFDFVCLDFLELTLTHNVNFQSRKAMVMTHALAKNQGQRSVDSKDGV